MSLQGHADAIERHLRNARSNPEKRDKELHFARQAYGYLKREAARMSDKQIQRDSMDAWRWLQRGEPGL